MVTVETPTWVDDLEFGGELIGEITTTCSATPCTKTNSSSYAPSFHPDHLGSILALSDSNTEANGTFTAQSYDSWGARRPVSIFNRSGTPPPRVREVAARIEWEPMGATEDGDGSIRTGV